MTLSGREIFDCGSVEARSAESDAPGGLVSLSHLAREHGDFRAEESCEGFRDRWCVSECGRFQESSPQETNRNLKPETKMRTLAKLTLAALAATTLGTMTLLAGPGPIGPANRPGVRITHPVKEMVCDRMVVNKAPRLGGPEVVKCTAALKDTAACRMACR
jgi:hypothetical protein